MRCMLRNQLFKLMNLIWVFFFIKFCEEFMLSIDNNPYVKRIEFESIMRPMRLGALFEYQSNFTFSAIFLKTITIRIKLSFHPEIVGWGLSEHDFVGFHSNSNSNSNSDGLHHWRMFDTPFALAINKNKHRKWIRILFQWNAFSLFDLFST